MNARDKEGDCKLVYSMDNSATYGSVVHRLGFSEAARRGIICPYNVVVGAITSDEVTEELLRRGETLVAGDVVSTRAVAARIGFQRAVNAHGVRKIFSFHNTVAAARQFTAPGPLGIGQYTSGLTLLHVNGAMRTEVRKKLLRSFDKAERAVLSNARCLTEGVDLPSVDMIAFMAPRSSRIDIVQAAGRAMRPSVVKSTGYIFVPVFVEIGSGESVEAAVARSDFSELWDVLQAMQEQDEELADGIRQMRQEQGRLGAFEDRCFRERVEILTPEISLELLRKTITALAVEKLGSRWDERYGELEAYNERFGDCDVPVNWPENPQLGTWVKVQRRVWRARLMRPDRKARLDALNFCWDTLDADWNRMYAEARQFKEANGHLRMYKGIARPELITWALIQRRTKRAGELSPDRQRRLDAIGFPWEPRAERWEEMFSRLLAYKELHGDCDVRIDYPPDPVLGRWVFTQRRAKTTGKLGAQRTARLQEAGFVWRPYDGDWEARFAELVAYREREGHCDVPSTWKANPQLAAWVVNQRVNAKAHELEPEQRERLNAVGFVWDPREAKWQEMFLMLERYKATSGDCNVPQNFAENPELGTWVANQRDKRESMNPERRWKLDALGFIWAPLSAVRKDMVVRLVRFRERHGHCNVPACCAEDPQLGRWADRQRQARKNGRLPAEVIAELDAIGFVWAARHERAQEMLERLSLYKARFGNCDVPQSWREDPELAGWVQRARNAKRHGGIDADLEKTLGAMGLSWDRRVEFVERMLSALRVFKNRFGHCNVPSSWAEDRQLAKWVDRQREAKKRGTLRPEIEAELRLLGLSWRRRDDGLR